MLRKSAWMLMVVVVLSTQAFTMRCDARCSAGAMAFTSMRDSIASSLRAKHIGAVAGSVYVSLCRDLLCKDDSASITKATAIAPPVAVAGVARAESVLTMAAQARLVRPDWQRRSSLDHPAFDPVLTSIRI